MASVRTARFKLSILAEMATQVDSLPLLVAFLRGTR